MKQCGTAAMDSRCEIGAIVTLKVDYQASYHARLLGIVFDFKPETGGIMVCYEHGMITHDRSKGDYLVLYDKYKVSTSTNATLPIAKELQSVRNVVFAGKYNSKVQKRISFSKYFDKEMDSTSPVNKRKASGCKRGAKNNCGCKRDGMKCHSGCMCNGNCDLRGV